MRSADFYTERVSYRSSALLSRLMFAAPLVTIASVFLASPALAATGLNPLLPDAVSPNGHNLYVLYNLISIPALVVFLLVEALLLTIILRDRRKRRGPDYRPPQTHGNTKLEIAWTIAPAVLLGVIGFLSISVLANDFLVQGDVIAANQGRTDVAITVQGYQFGWRYTYPEGFTVTTAGFNAPDNPMVIPTGALVRIKLQSPDVIHSFWVPELGGKTDAVPGYDNYAWFKVPQPGEFRGQCTELCGVGHGTMQIRVKAVTPDEYNAWVAKQVAKAKATPTPSPSPTPSAAPSPSASPSGSASPSPSPSGSPRPSPSPSTR
jgi:cytochrome c oxidase subunit II